jgi:hypothetical protein
MYRNLLAASLLLLCAALLVACSDPARIARREVDRLTKLTQATEVNVKRETRAVMLDVAKTEGKRRGEELKAQGCLSAMATQPSTALEDPCKGIVAASEKRYKERQDKVEAAAKKADAAIYAVYPAIAVVLDLIETIQAGAKASGWQAKLTAVVAKAAQTYADCVAAYDAFKKVITGGGVK